MQELFKDKIIHIPKENVLLIENMFYKIESEYKNKSKKSELIQQIITK